MIRSMSDREVGAALGLIACGGEVSVPVNLLNTLVSYAIAQPSNDVSRDLRDQAIERTRAAIVAEYDRRVQERPRPADTEP